MKHWAEMDETDFSGDCYCKKYNWENNGLYGRF